jgi:hypothetical protein
MENEKVLVIILGETRAHELTFDNIKTNLLNTLNADLALCIGMKPAQYDYNNPFYELAKYKFVYEEPDDGNYAGAFDYATEETKKNSSSFPPFETMSNHNAVYAKLNSGNEDIDYLYKTTNLEPEVIQSFLESYSELVHHSHTLRNEEYAGALYGVKTNPTHHVVAEEGVTTYKKHVNWRKFLHLQDQFLGGVRDQDPSSPNHPGSAGILLFLRWFLLKNLREHPDNILEKYNRFIITRSDYIYTLPHPKTHILSRDAIWIPDAEHYEGFTDRHVVLSPNFVEPYLNILESMVTKSNQYFMKMANYHLYKGYVYYWNLERLIYFHLKEQGLLEQVKQFPYVMYTVRAQNGSSSWVHGMGEFSAEHNYYIKYRGEYERSKQYEDLYKIYLDLKKSVSNNKIDAFYKWLI